MGTKANEAARTYFEQLVKWLSQIAAEGMHDPVGGGNYLDTKTFVKERCDRLDQCLKEYEIEPEVVQRGLHCVYDELMKYKRHETAAAFICEEVWSLTQVSVPSVG